MDLQDKPTELTKLVLKCQDTRTNKRELIDTIALLIYSYPKNRYNWNEDDCSDFFCQFFPKIEKMIDRFRYTGRPFEAYLYVTLRWQIKSFASIKQRREQESLFLSSKDEWVIEEDPELCVEEDAVFISSRAMEILGLNQEMCISNNAVKRRMMYLTLKAYQGLSPHIVENISLVTGYREEWIYTCLDRLRKKMGPRLERMEKLRRWRNTIFLRIYRIHQELAEEYYHENKLRLIKTLMCEKRKMISVIEKLSRVPRGPTHKDIADVLGVPKGSVDSGLYYIKNAFQHVDFKGEWRESA